LTGVAGGFVAYQHWWLTNWRSNVALGLAASGDLRAAQQPRATEQVSSVHVNLFWNAALAATFGLELTHATRSLVDGTDGELTRLQLTAIYKF
jgi:hypothetical protein